jgi:hypothetical protein
MNAMMNPPESEGEMKRPQLGPEPRPNASEKLVGKRRRPG